MKTAASVLFASFFFGSACTSCHDRVLQTAEGTFAVAEVHERVCGTSAGMSVAVLPPGTHEENGHASEVEPFRIGCTCSIEYVRTAKIMVAWTAPRELEVRYTRGVKPIRAETTWKEFTINYVEADIGSGKPRS